MDDGQTSIGEWLQQARKARGLTLDDISRQTKIPQRHLEALEHGNLGVLPGFYQRAEVRAFAREVGLDEQLAVGRLEPVATNVELLRDLPRKQPERVRATGFVSLALGTLGVVIVAAALFASVVSERTVASEAVAAVQPAPAPAPAPVVPPAAVEVPPAPVEPVAPRQAAVSVTPVDSPTATPPARPLPAATSAVTELVVRTEPAGARVTVNGIGWGMSPVTIRNLAAGDKHIRVSKDGYAAAERVLAIDDGRRRALTITLTSTP